MIGWMFGALIARQMNAIELPEQEHDDGADDNTRGVFDAFVLGSAGGTRLESTEVALAREAPVPWNRRQFFWEGFALGVTTRHMLTFSSGSPDRRYTAPGYRFMFYTGVGFYNGVAEQKGFPRVPTDAATWADSPDYSIGRPLLAGGTSFVHIASNLTWDLSVVAHLLVDGDDDWNRGVWVGCGRGLWFLYMRKFERLNQALDALPDEAVDAVALGLGLAITYTQLAEPERIASDIRKLDPRFRGAAIAGSRLCLAAALEDDRRLVDWRAELDEPLASWAREGDDALRAVDRSGDTTQQLWDGLFAPQPAPQSATR